MKTTGIPSERCFNSYFSLDSTLKTLVYARLFASAYIWNCPIIQNLVATALDKSNFLYYWKVSIIKSYFWRLMKEDRNTDNLKIIGQILIRYKLSSRLKVSFDHIYVRLLIKTAYKYYSNKWTLSCSIRKIDMGINDSFYSRFLLFLISVRKNMCWYPLNNMLR